MPVAILSSLELRWFDRAALPRAVREWFQTLSGPANQPERRTDTYLPTPGADNISVKLSRGSLETKLRLDRADCRSAKGRLEGVSERWIKWSWRYDAGAQDAVHDAFAHDQRGDWMELEKSRWQRKYRLVQDSPEPVDVSTQIDFGYAVEIVDGTFRGTPWWSFGLDVFAPTERSPAVLSDAIDRLESGFPLTMTRSRSQSYPAWLEELSG